MFLVGPDLAYINPMMLKMLNNSVFVPGGLPYEFLML